MRHRDRIHVHDLDHGRVVVDIIRQVAWAGRRGPWTASTSSSARARCDVCSFDDPGRAGTAGPHRRGRRPRSCCPVLLVSTDAVGIVRTWDVTSGRPLGAFRAAGRPDRRRSDGATRHSDRVGGAGRRPARRGIPRRTSTDTPGSPAVASELPIGCSRWPTGCRSAPKHCATAPTALAVDVFGRRACAGPGLGWALVVGTEEEVTGNLVLTSHTLEFVDRIRACPSTPFGCQGDAQGVVARDPDQCVTAVRRWRPVRLARGRRGAVQRGA